MKTQDPYQIIRRPLVTEKSINMKEGSNCVAFEVDLRANKNEIRRAVEKIFGVTVLDVNTLKVLGKIKGFRTRKGKRPDWKKAYVTLKPGDKIEFFEGV
ncbi:MAG: 50S ribosomal protein L23 [Candidatus Tectomicrobia bacterium]|uniref:Large ribosomal subunit protein uL23 n=1 Tax=Tectimicrobiota bacterium TaxID=2528274 RepID=A0A932FVI1_UNCTE|nr:50S ribosomal protein L23 [Candidatus Tectomicrobia bacterium]